MEDDRQCGGRQFDENRTKLSLRFMAGRGQMLLESRKRPLQAQEFARRRKLQEMLFKGELKLDQSNVPEELIPLNLKSASSQVNEKTLHWYPLSCKTTTLHPYWGENVNKLNNITMDNIKGQLMMPNQNQSNLNVPANVQLNCHADVTDVNPQPNWVTTANLQSTWITTSNTQSNWVATANPQSNLATSVNPQSTWVTTANPQPTSVKSNWVTTTNLQSNWVTIANAQPNLVPMSNTQLNLVSSSNLQSNWSKPSTANMQLNWVTLQSANLQSNLDIPQSNSINSQFSHGTPAIPQFNLNQKSIEREKKNSTKALRKPDKTRRKQLETEKVSTSITALDQEWKQRNRQNSKSPWMEWEANVIVHGSLEDEDLPEIVAVQDNDDINDIVVNEYIDALQKTNENQQNNQNKKLTPQRVQQFSKLKSTSNADCVRVLPGTVPNPPKGDDRWGGKELNGCTLGWGEPVNNGKNDYDDGSSVWSLGGSQYGGTGWSNAC